MGKKIENSSDNDSVENNDIFDIFMEETDEQLLLSKKKMILSEAGRTFEKFKLKLKAMDLLINILSNNKTVLKKNDLFEYDTFKKLLDMSKSNKTYYESFSKKIKTLSSLFVKNQISLNNEGKFEEAIKFVIEVMKNINYDNSYIQQILDLIKSNEKCYSLFLDKIFDSAFRGRNKVVTKDETRFIIRSFLKNPMILLEKLLKYSFPKQEQGARTPSQLNNLFKVIFYVFDSKKEFFVVENKEENDINLNSFIKLVKMSFKSNLKNDETTKKNFHVFFCLINLTHKVISLYLNKNYNVEVSTKEDLNKLISNFQTISTNINQLKNLNTKLDDLKNKLAI